MLFLFMTLLLLLLQQLLYCFPSPLISLLHSRVSLTLAKAGVHPGCKVYSVNPAALDVFKPAARLFSNFKLFTQTYQLYPCQGRWTAIKVPRRLLDLFKLCSPLIFKLFIKTSPHQETRIPSIFSTTVLLSSMTSCYISIPISFHFSIFQLLFLSILTFLPFAAAPLSLSSECPSIPVFQYSSINYIILYILFQPVFQPPSSITFSSSLPFPCLSTSNSLKICDSQIFTPMLM